MLNMHDQGFARTSRVRTSCTLLSSPPQHKKLAAESATSTSTARALAIAAFTLAAFGLNYARAQCDQWTAPFLPTATSGDIYASTTWDPDGSGPQPPQLVIGGRFVTAGGVTVNNIAVWDSTAETFRAFDAGIPGVIYDLTTWDPDADGPATPIVVAVGNFPTIGSLTVNHIAGWTGTEWRAFGPGFGSFPSAVATFDLDGSGPEIPQLICGSRRWNPSISTWVPLGPGGSAPLSVQTLTTWDSDGTGPLAPWLVSAGNDRSVRAFDGTSWRSLGGIADSFLWTLKSWDPDAQGPLTPRLFLVGDFTRLGSLNISYLAQWNGTTWAPVGPALNAPADALTTWDPDGTGPLRELLVIAGRFTRATTFPAPGISTTLNRVALWDGSELRPFPSASGIGIIAPIDGGVWTLTTLDPDAAGPRPSAVIPAGLFTRAGDATAGNSAAWQACPQCSTGFLVQPPSVRSCSTADVTISLAPSGYGPFTYEWQRADFTAPSGWRALTDGPLVINGITWGTVSGSDRSTLRLSPDLVGFAAATALQLRCIVTNACASATSTAATLTACPPNFNCDQAFDFFDYLDFVQAFADEDPRSDYNRSGTVDFFDYLDFIRAFDAGC